MHNGKGATHNGIFLNTELFYQPHKTITVWDSFPRNLDKQEYANPYLVLEKCLAHLDLAGWRAFLKDLFEAATYDGVITEAVQEDDLYYTCPATV